MENQFEEPLLAAVQTVLGEGGLLSQTKAVSGKKFVFNAAQLDYALRAAKGFCRKDDGRQRTAINMLQAATGTGKTMGYLVPLMLYSALAGKRVAVSTFTIQLQDQVLLDAELVAGLVAQITDRTLRVARRVGMSNYVSADAAAEIRNALEADHSDSAEQRSFLDELIAWVIEEDDHGSRVNSGILTDFLMETGRDSLPGIKASSLSLRSSDSEEEQQNYLRELEKTHQADVLVVNHALSVYNALRWGQALDKETPIAIMVFDEADRLPSAAEAFTNSDLSFVMHRKLVSHCAKKLGVPELDTEWQKTIDVLRDSAIQNVKHKRLRTNQSDTLEVQTQLKRVNTLLSKAKEKLGKSSLKKDEMVDFLMVSQKMKWIMDAIDKGNTAAAISWTPVRSLPSISIGNPFPGRALSRMWSRVAWEEGEEPSSYLEGALFTSATIGVPGRPMPQAFMDFMAEVGVFYRADSEAETAQFVQTDLFSFFEPSSFGAMEFVLADPRMDEPLKEIKEEGAPEYSLRWLSYATSMVQAAQSAKGRTLVLTASYADALALGQELAKAGTKGVLLHQRGSRLQDFLSAFKEDSSAILVTPTGWEGLDLPGLISHIVIPRIPFKNFERTDIVMWRMALEAAGMSEDRIMAMLYGRMTAELRKQLAQGFGRGIRCASDRVTIWIGDVRFPLPESLKGSVDPVVMAAPVSRNRAALVQAIPQRFRKKAYENARIFLENKEVYEPLRL